MPASEDLLFGKIALQLKYLNKAQLDEMIKIQAAGKPPIPLGELCVARGYITEEQRKEILEKQKKNLAAVDPASRKQREAILFGKVVIREGFASKSAVNECLRIQASEKGGGRSLGEIMVERGLLSAEQVEEILSKQLKKILRCPRCRLSFTVLTLTGGQGARCPRCKGALEDTQAKPSESVRTDGEFSTQIMRVVKVAGELDETGRHGKVITCKCVICDHTFDGALDPTGRIRCPSCHTTFTPNV